MVLCHNEECLACKKTRPVSVAKCDRRPHGPPQLGHNTFKDYVVGCRRTKCPYHDPNAGPPPEDDWQPSRSQSPETPLTTTQSYRTRTPPAYQSPRPAQTGSNAPSAPTFWPATSAASSHGNLQSSLVGSVAGSNMLPASESIVTASGSATTAPSEQVQASTDRSTSRYGRFNAEQDARILRLREAGYQWDDLEEFIGRDGDACSSRWHSRIKWRIAILRRTRAYEEFHPPPPPDTCGASKDDSGRVKRRKDDDDSSGGTGLGGQAVPASGTAR